MPMLVKIKNFIFTQAIVWGLIAIVYLVLNGLLYGVQEIYHWGDMQKAEALKVQLESLEAQIQELENEGRRNKGLGDKYAQYQAMVNEYNALVDSYNEIAQEAYSRWWLLPLPIPSRH